MSTHEEVDACEGKMHLPAYLRKVEADARFIITQRGRPVAELIPVDSNVRSEAGRPRGKCVNSSSIMPRCAVAMSKALWKRAWTDALRPE